METAASWLAALAAIVALVLSVQTSRRQRMQEENSYLVLALALSRVDASHVIASTSLENRTRDVKLLDTVFLLVSRGDEAPVDALNAILTAHDAMPVAAISEFGRATAGIDPQCSAGDRRYIRLDYYTEENSEVGDELLTYDAVLDVSQLQPGCTYSVRLFLYGPDRLHRVVQRAVIG